MNDFKGPDNVAINKTLFTTSEKLEMDFEEVDSMDLFEKDKQSLRNEGLIELHKQENKNENVELEPRNFTINKMQQTFSYMLKCIFIFEDMCPNAQSISKLTEAPYKDVAFYTAILEEKR